ncbi:hypothetical protein GCM10010411_74060 [Actinomadura fulvescens]|uniref:Uncharacterized protein n=1 Tax=Actinomadura fulvescens TaxID=46160 RepID=A0ABN3QHS7_9ACTN
MAAAGHAGRLEGTERTLTVLECLRCGGDWWPAWTLPTRSEAMIHVAMIDLMTRRLTGENTVTWRGT